MPLPSNKTAEKLNIKAGTKLICVKANYNAGLHVNDVCLVVNNLRSAAPNIKNIRTGKVRFIPLHYFDVLGNPIKEPAKPKTLDNLEVGDILTQDGRKRKVLAVCGEIVALSISGKFYIHHNWYTIHELKKYAIDFTPKQTITEVTKEQIAEKMGIPVEQLRIKEN